MITLYIKANGLCMEMLLVILKGKVDIRQKRERKQRQGGAQSEWVIGKEIVPGGRKRKRVGNTSERKHCRNEQQIEGGVEGKPRRLRQS